LERPSRDVHLDLCCIRSPNKLIKLMSHDKY
jgi:hypothetical protein